MRSAGAFALGRELSDDLHPNRDERGRRFTGGPFTDDACGYEFLEQAYRDLDFSAPHGRG